MVTPNRRSRALCGALKVSPSRCLSCYTSLRRRGGARRCTRCNQRGRSDGGRKAHARRARRRATPAGWEALGVVRTRPRVLVLPSRRTRRVVLPSCRRGLCARHCPRGARPRGSELSLRRTLNQGHSALDQRRRPSRTTRRPRTRRPIGTSAFFRPSYSYSAVNSA